MFDATKARTFLLHPNLKKDSDWHVTLLGGNVLALCLHFAVWLIVLILIEMGAFNCFNKFINVLGKNRIPEKTIEQLGLDEDVLEEEERVAQMDPSQL
jgi:hypothetical protein